MTNNPEPLNPGDETGWKALAMAGCGASVITLIVACLVIFAGRNDDSEGGIVIIAMLGLGALFALGVGIAALIGNGRDVSTRRWALLSLACAIASPIIFGRLMASFS